MKGETKPHKKVTAATMPPDIQRLIAKIADDRRWSLAATCGYFIERGLKAEGLLRREPRQEQQAE
jgi:hypothetical protein